MYAITHHHDYDELLLGPVDWKPRFIAAVLQQDLDLPSMPNISVADEAKVPYDIVENVRVRRVEQVFAEINQKTQRWDGPFWTYTDELATATYTAADKSIDQVKGELKNIVAAKRYEKETAGTTVTIQDVTVPVSTSRDDRSVYASAIPGPWKFTDGTWLTLTQEELNSIVTAVQTHVGDAFVWEKDLINTIDAASDLTTLDSIGI